MIGTVAASAVDRENPVTLEIHGSTGSIRVRHGELIASGVEPVPGALVRLPHPRDGLHAFIEALGHPHSANLVEPGTAARGVAIVEAAYRSAREGAAIVPEAI
jgi:predicted dehydrogenase